MDSRGRAEGGHSIWGLPPWVSGLNSAARVLSEKGERGQLTPIITGIQGVMTARLRGNVKAVQKLK